MAHENIPPGELIMTPQHEMFNFILNTSPPPGWRETVDSDFEGFLIARAETGLLEVASPAQVTEYLEGGEYGELPAPTEEEDNFEISYLV